MPNTFPFPTTSMARCRSAASHSAVSFLTPAVGVASTSARTPGAKKPVLLYFRWRRSLEVQPSAPNHPSTSALVKTLSTATLCFSSADSRRTVASVCRSEGVYLRT